MNLDSKPFDWTFNGEQWGPIAPGQVMDLPDEVAAHAIKRSILLDPNGDFERYRIDYLGNVPAERIKEIAMYDCPYALTGQCTAKPFKTDSDLRAHLESNHWPKSASKVPLVVGGSTKGAQALDKL